jgi:hypothetical protein
MRFRSLVLAALACAATVVPGRSEAGDSSEKARAIALFKAAFQGRCADHAFAADMLAGTEPIALTYHPSLAAAGEPDHHATLYQFFCDNFAHSGSAVFILKTHEGSVEIAAFATPQSTWRPDPQREGAIVRDRTLGFSATDILLNPDFDAETLTLTTEDHFGAQEYYQTFIFRDGMFVFTGDESHLFADGEWRKRPPETEQ